MRALQAPGAAAVPEFLQGFAIEYITPLISSCVEPYIDAYGVSPKTAGRLASAGSSNRFCPLGWKIVPKRVNPSPMVHFPSNTTAHVSLSQRNQIGAL